MKKISGSVLTIAILAATSPAFAQTSSEGVVSDPPMATSTETQNPDQMVTTTEPMTAETMGTVAPMTAETPGIVADETMPGAAAPGQPVVDLADDDEPSNVIDAGEVALNVPADHIVTTMENMSVETLMGAELRNPENEDIAEISDITIGADGVVNGVVADIGGFLGIGVRQVLIDPKALSFYNAPNADLVAYVSMTREQLEALPEYIPAANVAN